MTAQQAPTVTERQQAQQIARAQRAASVYARRQRRKPAKPAANDWYGDYLWNEYPTPGFGG
jgi:hypothetical protein